MSDILNVLGIPDFWSVIIRLGIVVYYCIVTFISMAAISSNLTKIINRIIKADSDRVNLTKVEQDWVFNVLFWLTILIWAFSHFLK